MERRTISSQDAPRPRVRPRAPLAKFPVKPKRQRWCLRPHVAEAEAEAEAEALSSASHAVRSHCRVAHCAFNGLATA